MDLDRIKQHIAHGEQGSVRDFSLALRGVVERTPDAGDFTPRTRSITAGLGLTGGGTLEEDRTLSLSEQSLDSLARANSAVQPDDLDWRDYKTSSMLVTDTGWDPQEDPVHARSTPFTASFSLGGHYDLIGAAGRNYKWGLMSWMTNPNTAPMTNISAVSQGWKVRSMDATSRQCGDDGEAHALEIIIGQYPARAKTGTVEGSNELTVLEVTWKGSRFCVGNTVIGPGIPEGAKITSVTKDGNTDTGYHVERVNYISGGSALQVGDRIISNTGGVFNRPCIARVIDISSVGIAFLVEDPGDCASPPSGSVSWNKVGGGPTGGLLASISTIRAGYGYPDKITISAPATQTSNNAHIRVLSADTMNIGVLISGGGEGGSDGTGNPNGRGIQFQSYGQAALRYGIAFGTSSLRPNGSAIVMTATDSMRALDMRSCTFEQVIRYHGGGGGSFLQIGNASFTSSLFGFSGVDAPYGLNFSANNSFSGSAAIRLEGQNIDTDDVLGMKLGTASTRKLAFWGATPIPQPAAIPDAAEDTLVDTVNALLGALRSAGLIAT